MPLTSMTGYADRPGTGRRRRLDLGGAQRQRARPRPAGCGFPRASSRSTPPLRQQATAALARGSVTVTLRVARAAGAAVPRLRPEALGGGDRGATRAAEAAAAGAGLDLAPVTAADLLALRGVMEAEAPAPAETPGVLAAVGADIGPLRRGARGQARPAEGAALAATLDGQLERIAALAAAARETAEAPRRPRRRAAAEPARGGAGDRRRRSTRPGWPRSWR